MKQYLAILMVLATLIGLLTGCAAPQGEDASTASPQAPSEQPGGTPDPAPAENAGSSATRTVTDWNSREVEVPETIQSIVCVNVSTLRYTTYLDALDLLAGVEENELGVTCAKPFSYLHQDLFETLPLTGNNGETYVEQIIAADPDVIVAYFDADSADTLQAQTNIPVVTIPHLEGILDDEVFFTLEFLGDLYGRQDRAAELTAYLQDIQTDISSRIADIAEEDRPTVYVAGVSYKGAHGFEGTEAGYGPLAALGAVNIADSTGQTTPFDMDVEEVLRLDPDYIFVDTGNLDLVNEQYAQNPDFYNSFTAVQEGRVYSQISFRFNATNTELALADLYYMASVIYPDAFSDIDPIEKANEIFEMFLGEEDYYAVLSEAGFTFGPVTLGA